MPETVAPSPAAPSGTAPTTPAQPKQNQKTAKKPRPGPGETVSGAVLPGAGLTALIGFCWLGHHFGLAAAVAALLACAAATAALLAKGRRKSKSGSTLGRSLRTARRQARAPGRAASGLGGGRSASGKPSGLSGFKGGGGSAAAKRATSTLGATAGAGARPRSGTSASSGSPTGMGSRGKPRSMPGSASGTRPRAGNGTSGGLAGRGLSTTRGRPPHPAKGLGKAARPGTGAADRARAIRAGRRAAKANRGHDGTHGQVRPDALTARLKKAATSPWTDKKKTANKPKTKASGKGKHRGDKKPTVDMRKKAKKSGTDKVSSRSTVSRSAPMGARRRGAYWVGRKLRKHTSRRTRSRLRTATAPVRHTVRAVRRYGAPVLAHTWRAASRTLLNAHMALGNIRFSTIGPNWLRPLARVFHTLTSPGARLLAAAGTWDRLNRWVYQHTNAGARPTRKPETPRPAKGAKVPHQRVGPPGTSTPPHTSTKGTSVSALQPAAPLTYAAEAVRTAGAMLLISPAENMVGYEATIRSLTEVQMAIGDVIRMAAASSRSNFKVNEAIPEAYDDTATYAYGLAGRLESIPTLFRMIHAEQLDNIENPTIQGSKWDQSANW